MIMNNTSYIRIHLTHLFPTWSFSNTHAIYSHTFIPHMVLLKYSCNILSHIYSPHGPSQILMQYTLTHLFPTWSFSNTHAIYSHTFIPHMVLLKYSCNILSHMYSLHGPSQILMQYTLTHVFPTWSFSNTHAIYSHTFIPHMVLLKYSCNILSHMYSLHGPSQILMQYTLTHLFPTWSFSNTHAIYSHTCIPHMVLLKYSCNILSHIYSPHGPSQILMQYTLTHLFPTWSFSNTHAIYSHTCIPYMVLLKYSCNILSHIYSPHGPSQILMQYTLTHLFPTWSFSNTHAIYSHTFIPHMVLLKYSCNILSHMYSLHGPSQILMQYTLTHLFPTWSFSNTHAIYSHTCIPYMVLLKYSCNILSHIYSPHGPSQILMQYTLTHVFPTWSFSNTHAIYSHTFIPHMVLLKYSCNILSHMYSLHGPSQILMQYTLTHLFPTWSLSNTHGIYFHTCIPHMVLLKYSCNILSHIYSPHGPSQILMQYTLTHLFPTWSFSNTHAIYSHTFIPHMVLLKYSCNILSHIYSPHGPSQILMQYTFTHVFPTWSFSNTYVI